MDDDEDKDIFEEYLKLKKIKFTTEIWVLNLIN